jgi:hypothetical protein
MLPIINTAKNVRGYLSFSVNTRKVSVADSKFGMVGWSSLTESNGPPGSFLFLSPRKLQDDNRMIVSWWSNIIFLKLEYLLAGGEWCCWAVFSMSSKETFSSQDLDSGFQSQMWTVTSKHQSQCEVSTPIRSLCVVSLSCKRRNFDAEKRNRISKLLSWLSFFDKSNLIAWLGLMDPLT